MSFVFLRFSEAKLATTTLHQALGVGISTALITTIIGLIIRLLTTLAHGGFVNKLYNFEDRIREQVKLLIATRNPKEKI